MLLLDRVIDGKEIVNRIVRNEGVSDPDTGKLTHNLTIKKAIIDLKGKNILKLKRLVKANLFVFSIFSCKFLLNSLYYVIYAGKLRSKNRKLLERLWMVKITSGLF